jgi:hypothetical protein
METCHIKKAIVFHRQRQKTCRHIADLVHSIFTHRQAWRANLRSHPIGAVRAASRSALSQWQRRYSKSVQDSDLIFA